MSCRSSAKLGGAERSLLAVYLPQIAKPHQSGGLNALGEVQLLFGYGGAGYAARVLSARQGQRAGSVYCLTSQGLCRVERCKCWQFRLLAVDVLRL